MILLPAILAIGSAQKLNVDWNAALRRFLRYSGRLGQTVAQDFCDVQPEGLDYEPEADPVTVAGLKSGRILWIGCTDKDDNHDAARILVWLADGDLHGQVLQKHAFAKDFAYGEGVLSGPALFTNGKLFIAGPRYCMSPACHGGVEVWNRHGEHWKLAAELTTDREVDEDGVTISPGPVIEIEIDAEPEGIAGRLRGNIPAIDTIRYRNGRLLESIRPIESPIHAVDQLVAAATHKNSRIGLSRTTPAIWSVVKASFREELRVSGEQKSGSMTVITLASHSGENDRDLFKLTLAKQRGRYRIIAFKRLPTKK